MITPTEEERTSIIKCLKELDCCSRCILRYLGEKKFTDVYIEPEEYLKALYPDDDQKVSSEPLPKKFKNNPCRLCLDIFEHSTLERFAERVLYTNINEYKYSDYCSNVSFPKVVMIRNHSMFIYLKEKFPNIYNDENGLDNLNRVFKMSSSGLVSQKINKIFSKNSDLTILFEIGYEDDEMEIQHIKKLHYLIKKGKQKDFSRNVIMDILEKCDDEIFKTHFSVPPNIPVKGTYLEVVQCTAEPIFLGGRYLKFSRDMGQTPWIINNKIMAQHCLQDIIFDSVEKVLGCDKKKLTFCASGREDADVRMLGDGRPFYIQIDDPKDTTITFQMYRDIELEIFKSKLAAVIKLQKVSRNDIKRIKDGEQYKRKHYVALCQVVGFDMYNTLKQINAFNKESIEVCQKTPMRVLHRRTQAVRLKYIYSMEAKDVPDNPDLIEVKLVTQAGTYVKEFICGDFERTQPSLSSMLKFPIDVVALDVVRVELAWPEESEVQDEPK